MSIDEKALKILEDRKLPDWLPDALVRLMEIAEDLLPGGTGAQKKAWVIAAAKDLARKHDIKAIPDPIENVIEGVLISVAIEALWGLLFKDRGGVVEAPVGLMPNPFFGSGRVRSRIGG